MILINAKDFGIIPGMEITEKLTEMLAYSATVNGSKTITFDKGIYHIDSVKCIKKLLYITNTAGDEEYQDNETPHLNNIAFYLDGVSDLTLDGNDSVFVIDGKATNVALVDSENVAVRNLEIRHANPDMHELKVVKKS